MAENNASQVKELTDRLQAGVKDIFTSGVYANYLKTMSRFHAYSLRNIQLIYMQKPTASFVCGYRSWQDKFGRRVVKGAKAIKILAPAPIVIREEQERLDPNTKKPVLDDDGMPIIDQIEKKLARFKVTNVFDILDTEGKPLPTLAQDLTGNVEQYTAFMDALGTVSPLPIVIEPLPENKDGVCIFGNKISIRSGMSEIQTVCAVIHEIVHAKLHDLKLLQEIDENAKPKDRRTEEIESESIAYTVAQFFGIETGANSFGYIAEWSRGRELSELNASLDTIRKTSAELIDAIEMRFKEIIKERKTPLSISELQNKNVSIFSETRPVGETVLMPLLFEDGNLNRTGKRTRVKIESPIGKYPVYSHKIGTSSQASVYAHLMTESGKLINVGTMEQMDKITEQRIDEFFAESIKAIENQLADPTMWADFQAAAIANRIDEAETHNIPVRELRESERVKERAKQEARQEAERKEHEDAFNATVNNISDKIIKSERVDIERDHYIDKNPLLTLFSRHSIELPLATKGWINSKLKAFQLKDDNSLIVWGPKGLKISETFAAALRKLKTVIEEEKTIEQIGGIENLFGKPTPPPRSVSKKVERENYRKLAEMFPEILNGEYSYLRLEAGGGFEPLSIEWVGDNRLSIMHTYTMNGDLMYDPMMTFNVDTEAQTMTAAEYEMSMPPLYQRTLEDGGGISVDGNGHEQHLDNLQMSLNGFASEWFNNIAQQGYIPVKANLVIGENNEVSITFDKEGKTILPENYEKQSGYEEYNEIITAEKELEEKLYDKFTKLFPKFMSGDYTQMTLEAVAAKPLSLEWVFGDRISIMHSYDRDGQLAYEPCVMLLVNSEKKTLTASSLELSEPYRNDVVYDSQGRANVGMQQNINSFMSQWLDKIEQQGFVPRQATAELNGGDIQINFDEDGKALIPLKDDAILMPDPAIGLDGMNQFGYTHDGMIPLTNSIALDFFDMDYTVYLLYKDNTEAMALDRTEIENHDGIFGIERQDWETSHEYAALKAKADNLEGKRESEFLHGNGNRFAIYQIRNNEELRDYQFSGTDELKRLGLEINRKNYELVYTDTFEHKIEFLTDRYPALNKIYEQFNVDHPKDFTGHSLSVSDVVVLKCNNDISSHFCDSVGFTEIDAFLGDEKQHTEALKREQERNETTDLPERYSQIGNTFQSVVQIETNMKASKTFTDNSKEPSSAHKGKTTLMERLEEGKRKASQGMQKSEPVARKELQQGYDN